MNSRALSLLLQRNENRHLNMYQTKKAGDSYIVSIDNGCGIAEALSAFCREHSLSAGGITGLGAVRTATLRFLDPATLKYVDRTFDEQMEIANLTGNISRKDGEVYLHIHASLGRRDYSMVGGHLLEAVVNGACELFVHPLPGTVGRREDEATGLNLYDF